MAAMVIVLIVLYSSLASAEEISIESTGESQWTIHGDSDAPIGTLKKTEDGNFSLYNAEGGYVGIILAESKKLRPPGLHTAIGPAEARLYLDALKVLPKSEEKARPY